MLLPSLLAAAGDFDVTTYADDAKTAIEGALTAMGTVLTAFFAVVVAWKGYRIVKRAVAGA